MTASTPRAEKVLIIGPAGPGKTFVANRLCALGVNAYDANAVYGLIRFVDDQGQAVPFPLNADEALFSRHHFVWDVAVLQQLLATNDTLYLFGTSENAWSLCHLFDRTYYLKADRELIRRRLVSPERDNPMGATEEQRELILKGLENHDRQAEALNLPTIDASRSPEEIFEAIPRAKATSS